MLGRDIEQPPNDQDRTRVIEALRVASPVLGLEEIDRRMEAAVKASSIRELALLVWDLPTVGADPTPAPTPPRRRSPVSVWRNVGFRAHATVYGGVNTMLVGIWALTGGIHEFFWPFFPIAGWGIGVGMHALGAHEHEKRKAERQARRLDRGGPGAAAGRGAAVGLAGDPAAPPELVRQPTSPRPSGRPARTSVVVMFTDIVDSTRLTLVLGDEDWARVRARYRDILRDCYAAYAGTEVNSQGDGFLARFGSAGLAAQCASEIQSRLQAQRDQTGFAPSIRTGITSGEAIDEGGDLLGAVVNLAARLMTTAQPNEILLTEAVADRLDGRFHLLDGGLRDLKGLDRSCHVFILDRT